MVNTRRPSAGIVGLLAMIAFGVVATFFALGDTRNRARDDDERAAALAAASVSGALEATVAAVRGADVLVADGEVDADDFAAFADSVIRDTLYRALAYAQVVESADRDAFIAETGIAITDTDGSGGFVPAPSRPRSIVVTDVYPVNPTTSELIGFDLAGEPTRRRATDVASNSRTPVLSDRTTIAGAPTAGLSVFQAVRSAQGDVVGFVTSGITLDDVLSRAGVDLDSTSFGLSMDGQQLTPNAPTSGATSTFEVAGRTFEVRAVSGGSMSLFPALPLAVGTVALAIAVGVIANRDREQQYRLARFAERSRAIAELANALTTSNDEAKMLADIADRAGEILDGAVVIVARRSLDDPTVVRIEATSESLEEASVDTLLRGPIASTLGSGTRVVLDDDLRSYRTVVSVPLRFSGGFTFGALAFAWREPVSPTELDERSVAADTIAELAGSALERAAVANVVRTSAEQMTVFARSLAASHTSEDVRSAVAEFVPRIVGAESAVFAEDTLEPHDQWPTDGEVRQIVLAPDRQPAGVLVVRWRRPGAVATTQLAVITTLANLIGQTVDRTARAQLEHDIILQLQRDLLPPPVAIDGLDVEVSYLPAMSLVGLGGDFYDVIASEEGRVFVVIGDITGHGSRAVAAMSELKSAMQHLLRSGASIDLVCAQADVLLAERHMLATVQICEFDLELEVVRYVNAGHPYPILRRASGETVSLQAGHRRLLGLSGEVHTVVASSPFSEGDALLLYTDGLIERRDQPIDVAIAGLVRLVADSKVDSMPAFVAHLQARLLDAAERTDDDVAIVAIRNSGSRGQSTAAPQRA
jgi:serine phosphatase RsbU (regulator of sigma subunit)